jgi:hypothetical protein
MAYHTPNPPTQEHMDLMKERYEVSGKGLIVKTKYHCGPEVGEEVGSRRADGYLLVKVKCRGFLVHRVVWFLAYGSWPEMSIDHIDGDKKNNHPDNLRLVSHSENCKGYNKPSQGTTSKYRGVSYDKEKGKYQASARPIHIGYYETEEEAAIARSLYAYEELGWPWETLDDIGKWAVGYYREGKLEWTPSKPHTKVHHEGSNVHHNYTKQMQLL